jgi:uncharacterized protein (DUF58 family)
MVFAMLFGSMNYNNSSGLALTFLLIGLGLVAMHHCHRNLTGLAIAGVRTGEAFAGEMLPVQIGLENPDAVRRFELSIECQGQKGTAQRIDPSARTLVGIELPAARRGILAVERLAVSTRFPFGLFHAWCWLHLPLEAVVYPRPVGTQTPPATVSAAHAEYRGREYLRSGSEDFRGFRDYAQGDSPRHIYWKALARGAPLLVKEYATAGQVPAMFDFDSVLARETEARLSQLCRWVVDAERGSAVYGLKLPNRQIPLGSGAAHRRRCLTALALFGSPQLAP